MSNTSTVSSFCSLKLDSCCLLGLNTIWRATWPLFAAFVRYCSSLYSNSAVFFEYDGSNSHFETDFLLHVGENHRKISILFRTKTDIMRNHIALRHTNQSLCNRAQRLQPQNSCWPANGSIFCCKRGQDELERCEKVPSEERKSEY